MAVSKGESSIVGQPTLDVHCRRNCEHGKTFCHPNSMHKVTQTARIRQSHHREPAPLPNYADACRQPDVIRFRLRSVAVTSPELENMRLEIGTGHELSTSISQLEKCTRDRFFLPNKSSKQKRIFRITLKSRPNCREKRFRKRASQVNNASGAVSCNAFVCSIAKQRVQKR
jgi:hypothetical protein